MKESDGREVNLRNRARNGERDFHGNCTAGLGFGVANLCDLKVRMYLQLIDL